MAGRRKKKHRPAPERPNPGAQPAPTPARPAGPGPWPEKAALKSLGGEAAAFWPWLLGLLALSAALRFYRLGAEGLWLDEAMILANVQGRSTSVSPAHMFHMSMVNWFEDWLGPTAFAIRLWSALTGSLAPVFLTLGGLWLGGRRLAVSVGVLAAVNPFLVLYSQDANYYGAMSFFACAQFAAFVAVFRGAPLFGTFAIGVLAGPSHFTHPFASLYSAVLLALAIGGVFVLPRLRREAIAWHPRGWPRRPWLPAALVLGGIGAATAAMHVQATILQLSRALELNSTLRGVSFDLDFFLFVYRSFGVVFARPEPWADVAAWPVFAMAVVGTILIFTRSRKWRAALPVGVVCVAVPLASYLVLFNLEEFREFNLRYFTFHVPLYLLGIATTCCSVGSLWRGREKPLTSLLLAGVVAVQSPFILRHLVEDRTNFRGLVQHLAGEWREGDEIVQLGSHDEETARAHFREEPGLWPHAFRPTHLPNDKRTPEWSRNATLHYLWGRERVWLYSEWRHEPIPDLWEFQTNALPVAYRGRSSYHPLQDALLSQWDFGTRALLPSAAVLCEEPGFSDGDAEWFAGSPGRWRLSTPGQDVRLSAEGKGVETRTDAEGRLVLKTPRAGSFTLKSDGPVSAVLAEPFYPPQFTLYPQDAVDYPVEPRNVTYDIGKDKPVAAPRFDATFAFILYTDPDDAPRQLVLRAIQRRPQRVQRETRNPDADARMYYEVSVNGRHQGVWLVPPADGQRLLRIPTDIRLPPGNARVEVFGFTPRIDDQNPLNRWPFGGLEYNAGEPEQAVSPLDAETLQMTDYEPLLWGEPGAAGLPEGSYELAGSYNVSVSERMRGPSGQPALEVDLTPPLRGAPNAYNVMLLPLVPVRPGELFTMTTYIRSDATRTHAANLIAYFVGADNETKGFQMATAHYVDSEHTIGWRRQSLVTPVPPNAAAILPGIAVFPPNPEVANPWGRFWIDAVYPMPGPADAEFREPSLDSRLFFEQTVE